ncbi:MAG: TMEM165/GDT1 family protein [Deltaproteobacteria bacterium]|nr:TMEM165/GDT1 family protein [Deltaproteobacteria bacterium]
MATFSFAADSQSRLAVFLGSAGALVATSLLAVLFGAAVSRVIPAHYLRYGAGGLFVLLGLWMLIVPAGK